MFSLNMRRGKRIVFIGTFPSKYRASQIGCILDWDPSWKPVIEKIRGELCL